MLLQITVALLQIIAKCYYKLRQLYCKLRQCVITNYGSFIKLLQITAAFGVITNYGNILLQITAGITNYDVITNYVVSYLDTQKFWATSHSYASDTRRLQCADANNPLQTVFKRVYTVYSCSNCMTNQLL